MTRPEEGTRILRDWRQIPVKMEKLIASLGERELDRRVGKTGGMSARETIHHVTEANIVSAAMMIAALGANGATFDWSWLFPNRDWTTRMGYGKAPVGPAIETLKGLTAQLSNIIRSRPDALKCKVKLFDTPGGKKYSKTVGEILREEAAHAKEHLDDLQQLEMKREKHPIPDFVLEALRKRRLFDTYSKRPPYQQNDYVGWIMRAKLPVTRQKRLDQMLDELAAGGVYMKMKHNPSKPAAR